MTVLKDIVELELRIGEIRLSSYESIKLVKKIKEQLIKEEVKNE
jgi:hypothetical protein